MHIGSLIIALILSYVWPFQSIDHRIHRGYGDFNGIAGFHQGIDVYSPSNTEPVYSPFPSAYVYGAIQTPLLPEWSVLLTQSDSSSMGLLYEHIIPDSSFAATDTLGNTVGTCYNPSGISAVRHVHIANFATADWIPGQLLPQAGYSDVLADFSIPVHYASFAPVLEASIPLSGIGFWPEGVPLALDILRGAVDFRIAARSANSGSSSVDSTGVRKLEINSISRENPFTEEYTPYEYYSPRTVFDWSQELEPNAHEGVPLDEYRYLYQYFMGGTVFDYSYICTNSSNLDTGTQGIDNIWTEPYDSQVDWLYSQTHPEIRCRGAWDTILKKVWTATDQSACENSDACFPDGKYLVDVTATSHTGNTASISLPVDSVTSPNHSPVGIIVDNFVPFVDEVIFYSIYSEAIVNTIYNGTWLSVSDINRKLSKEIYGYLLPGNFGKASQDDLGIAVHFSEPMNESDLPSVWLEGEWGGEVRWSSLDDRRFWFTPCDMSPELEALLDPESDEYGQWVYYQTLEYNSPGYVGSLSINIGEAPISIPGAGIGTDLAGNPLDVLPEDIAPPIPVQAPVFTTGVDCSHSYGSPPVYENGESYYPPYPLRIITHGAVINEEDLTDTLYTVDIEISQSFLTLCDNHLSYARLDCPYYSGYWLCGREIQGYLVVGLIYPDESFSSTTLGDLHSGGIFTNPTGDYVLSVHHCEEPCGAHFWETYTFSAMSREFSNVFYEEPIVEGPAYCYPPWNTTEITSTEWLSDYTVRFNYWQATAFPDQGFYGYKDFNFPVLRNSYEDTDFTLCTSLEIDVPAEEYQFSLSLSQNPVVSSTIVTVTVPNTGHVTLQIFDLSGRLVQTLLSEKIRVGNNTVNWDIQMISSGVYFVRLTTTAGTVSTQAMVLR